MLTDAVKTLQALIEFDFPEPTARAGWEFDPEACLDAKIKLGIQFRIKFKFMTGKRRRGTHYVRHNDITNETYHQIMIDQNREAEAASETLWHEMAHAMQAEMWSKATGNDPWKFYRLGYKKADGEWGHSYYQNKYEIHARKVADLNKFNLLVI